jgi:uncharacterized protein YbjT (DUF2867 family)
MAANPMVLVTGGSGFVGGHVLLQALDAGSRVRTTVRSLQRERAPDFNWRWYSASS